MHSQPSLMYALVRDTQQRQIDEAARERLIRTQSPSPSIRRTVGRRIASIGARIAAEPSLELARSR